MGQPESQEYSILLAGDNLDLDLVARTTTGRAIYRILVEEFLALCLR